MTTNEILNINNHRPWNLPNSRWKYYQEWNNAIFLHWQVNGDELSKFVPAELEIDLHNDQAWVSLVAFTMEKIRPRNLPAFPPISDFHEINIRTYVKYNDKAGVYFLSIEGGKRISCQIAKKLSELPYRYSKMSRQENYYTSSNQYFNDKFELNYHLGLPITKKTALDKWLTERYALFQDSPTSINQFEIHHIEWPTLEIDLEHLEVYYPRFSDLLNHSPALSHYSTGVQVIAWDKVSNNRST